MRFVLDSNCLEDKILEDFLSSAKSNSAVLSDYLWIEAYKGDDYEKIFQRIEILARHRDQLIFLKPISVISHLRGERARLATRMIDHEAPLGFERFVRLYKRDPQSPELARAIHGHHLAAQEYIAAIAEDPEELVKSFLNVAEHFGPRGREVLRTRQKPDRSTILAMLNMVDEFATSMLQKQKFSRKIRDGELQNLYLFRFAVCGVCLAMRWIRSGSPPRKREKIRNDIIDLTFAAHGTFFDGVLSRDVGLKEIHNEAWAILKHMGAAIK